jgi:hypothetical protein
VIINKKLRHFTYFQARYASFKKMADLSPETSNTFKLPLFEIAILKDKKGPRTLVQILSPGGASCFFMFAAAFKKLPDDVFEKSAIQLPIYNGFLQLYASGVVTGVVTEVVVDRGSTVYGYCIVSLV